MLNFLKVYLLFWIFSFCGWIMEEIVCSICDKKIVNRGFLLGPYCPIYGFGGLVILLLIPYKNAPLTCFILSLILCSVIEYITSYLMEKIFKVRFWDYSNDTFNINGRICLRNSIAFGLLGLIGVRYAIPFVFSFLSKFSITTIYISSLVLSIITLIDIVISFNVMNNIKDTIILNLDKFKNRDATNDIKEMLKRNLLDNKILEKHIVKAFNNVEREVLELLDKLDEKFDKLCKKVSDIKNTYFTLLGLLIGIIGGYFTKNYTLLLTLGIITGFLADIIIYRIREKKNGK